MILGCSSSIAATFCDVPGRLGAGWTLLPAAVEILGAAFHLCHLLSDRCVIEVTLLLPIKLDRRELTSFGWRRAFDMEAAVLGKSTTDKAAELSHFEAILTSTQMESEDTALTNAEMLLTVSV